MKDNNFFMFVSCFQLRHFYNTVQMYMDVFIKVYCLYEGEVTPRF